ncbi:hypothetical protein [Endozoicomonas arenosclerae]|uniref:hypothetical protein n=1 Tax=Endozoicomonas arenosclerae TaxID=1633495 RepID=UPI000785B46D|nr:hypothetical protein [Endozoicomonas arenosclerae]
MMNKQEKSLQQLLSGEPFGSLPEGFSNRVMARLEQDTREDFWTGLSRDLTGLFYRVSLPVAALVVCFMAYNLMIPLGPESGNILEAALGLQDITPEMMMVAL